MAPAEPTAEAFAPIETKSLRKEPSMQPQSTSTPDPATAQPAAAAQPQLPLARQMVTAMAEKFGVCTRPLAIRRIERFTGFADVIEVPCLHQKSTLGYTGRRVLISRQWSGKTLADLRADNRTWVRAILSGTLADPDSDSAAGEEPRRYVYELARPGDPDVPDVQARVLAAIGQRQAWRQDLREARTQAAAPPGTNSATQDPGAIGRAA
jgi:hypothetical protein